MFRRRRPQDPTPQAPSVQSAAQLGDTADAQAVTEALAALRSADDGTQLSRAVGVLYQLGRHERAKPTLHELARHGTPDVRIAAIAALADRELFDRDENLVALLVELRRDSDLTVAETAVACLTSIPTAGDALVDLLDEDESTRLAAAASLERASPPPIRRLIEFAESDSTTVAGRLEAARVLASIGVADGGRLITQIAGGTAADDAAPIERRIAAILELGKHGSAPAIPLLERLSRDSNARVRRACIAAWKERDDDSTSYQLVLCALSDSDSRNAEFAAGALQGRPCPAATEAMLVNALTARQEEQLNALRVLAVTQPAAPLRKLSVTWRSYAPPVRARAMRVLVQHTSDGTGQAIAALADDNAEVRDAAASALAAAHCRAAAPTLLAAASDDRISPAVLDAVARLDAAALLLIADRILGPASPDCDDPRLRATAVALLRPEMGSSARPLLERALGDPDRAIRTAAVRAARYFASEHLLGLIQELLSSRKVLDVIAWKAIDDIERHLGLGEEVE